jgi:hypothetical protein
MAKITDQMVYLVVMDHKSGAYFPEQSVAETDRKTVVRDIASGQYDGLLQVLELNPVEGICRDVTEDICREVMNTFANEGEPLTAWQYEFVDLHVGTAAANSFARAA